MHIDALDENLLADRERFLREESKVEELTILQQALFGVTRDEKNREDERMADGASLAARLPLFSRPHFVEPITALWMTRSHDDENAELEIRDLGIKLEPVAGDSKLATLSSDGKSFSVNTQHPYYEAISKVAGSGKKGGRIIREYELLAISETLFEGYLIDIGLPLERVQEIVSWRNDMYKVLAGVTRTPLEQLEVELREASHKGGKHFENAIKTVLEHMGFIAERDGASGEKDILMRAPAGDHSYKLTFEAKGKKSKNDGKDSGLPNDAAEISGAESHRLKAGAEHAVIVTRKFAGFVKSGEPAVIEECMAVGGTVSIMETEALIELARTMEIYAYPLDMVKGVFTAVETPAKKLDRIRGLRKPFEDFDYYGLLENIWKKQDEIYDGQPVSWHTLYHESYRTTGISKEEFGEKIAALSTLASDRIVFRNEAQLVALRQSPSRIAERIENHFGKETEEM